ncbi:MAG: hypothetical protein L3J74_02310 [Bacteroidales bacterium]|nr:hypothetical protein [Bacteroidales bacterium]
MKKILFISLLALYLFSPLTLRAQRVSKIAPVKVYWLADGKMYDINAVQSGIRMPKKLEFVVVLSANQQLQGQKFEFKWYHRGPTRDYLTNSFIIKVALKPGEKQITLKSGVNNLKSGWCKVQVNAYIDRKPLSYQNKYVFWIKIL